MSLEKSILLVEDSPDDQELTLRALRRNRILNRVVVIHDGAEALDYLLARGAYGQDKPRLPALILLDLKLPKIDGVGVLQQLRANERARMVPVVVLTSSREERDVSDSYRYGANSYIRKPVDFTEFSETVRQMAVYWLVLNEAPPDLRG